MHQMLREATSAAHESLDGLFGSLDLASEDGYARFLAAHLIGNEAMHPVFRAFVAEQLGLEAPDFPAMLRDDLAAMGVNWRALPAIPLKSPVDAAGITYVVSGSRLGLAMIRKRDYWGKQAGRSTSYMEDTGGLDIWRALVRWMGAQSPDRAGLEAASASARQAFEVFREAFALTSRPAR